MTKSRHTVVGCVLFKIDANSESSRLWLSFVFYFVARSTTINGGEEKTVWEWGRLLVWNNNSESEKPLLTSTPRKKKKRKN